jgi:hypothetical protein
MKIKSAMSNENMPCFEVYCVISRDMGKDGRASERLLEAWKKMEIIF